MCRAAIPTQEDDNSGRALFDAANRLAGAEESSGKTHCERLHHFDRDKRVSIKTTYSLIEVW